MTTRARDQTTTTHDVLEGINLRRYVIEARISEHMVRLGRAKDDR